jgi:transketolase
VTGVYALRKVGGAKKSGTLVLQGNGVATAFVTEVLPVLDQKGIALNVFYVASAELFDLLSPAEKEKIFPEKYAQEAIGITEFTLPTLYRWVTSAEGRKRSLHPFKAGHFLGSGQGSMVLEEAQLGKEAQLKALIDYAKAREL